MVQPVTAVLPAEVAALAEAEGRQLIPALQAVQRRYGYLPEEALAALAGLLRLPLSQLYGVATFYHGFHLEPRGRTVVRVCQGTACHVLGARRVTEALSRHLGVPAGKTTADREYTLEAVACLGCCSLAPVVAVGEQTHGRVDHRQTASLVPRAGPPEPP